jgi:hypothetical protein
MEDSVLSSSAPTEPPNKKKRLKQNHRVHDNQDVGKCQSKQQGDANKNHRPVVIAADPSSSLSSSSSTTLSSFYSTPLANCTLRCNPDIPKNQQSVLWWYSAAPPIPSHVEDGLLDLLLKYGRHERGMFRDKPEHVIAKLQKRTDRDKIPLLAALSLRRNHMKHLNPARSMPQLRLGNEEDIRQSAHIFETVMADYLTAHNISFYSEAEQKSYIQSHRQPGQPHPPTPDFLLQVPIRIQPYRIHRSGQKHKLRANNNNNPKEPMTVHWIEVKMFYGASTVPQDGKTGVGCVLATAQKYVQWYGPGAMVFYYGFGDQLQIQLAQLGVLCLDGCGSSSAPSSLDGLDVRPVQTHQRTWCADAKGRILP